MIIYEKERKKGFRGYKYIAKAYIDIHGNEITNDTKDGTDMIEIVCDITSNKEEQEVLKSLKEEIINKIKEYKPIWQK